MTQPTYLRQARSWFGGSHSSPKAGPARKKTSVIGFVTSLLLPGLVSGRQA